MQDDDIFYEIYFKENFIILLGKYVKYFFKEHYLSYMQSNSLTFKKMYYFFFITNS